jgi:hypothetical protein
VEKEALMFQRAPPRSIMAFENFSSVKAKTWRSTRGDQVIDLGIHVLDARVRQHDPRRL